MPEKFDALFREAEGEKDKGPVYKFKKLIKTPEGKVEREFVSVCGVELEVNVEGRGTQFGAEEFEDFALDDKTVELLKIYAKAIKLNQPPLVEGPTDIGKSKVLEYLAFLTNNFLIYQSFSGQTDVSELIGKYVPNTEDARKTFERILAQKNRGSLKLETLAIIAKINAEKEPRGFTKEECMKIAELEGLSLDRAEWVWQDGTVPRAMEFDGGNGAWLYFDELGAAEPQILVKLNRVFARGMKRIEITENGGREVVGGKNFRFFATTNPPSYAGREPFEKDFLRRWVYQKVSALGQKDFKARLDFAGLRNADKGGRADIFGRPEINELLNDLIVSFAFLAQDYLDKIPKDPGEQQFRMGDFTDALRVAEYLRIFGADDLLAVLRDAVEFYYIGKVDEDKQDSSNKNVRKKLRKILDTALAAKDAAEKLKALLDNPEIVKARTEIKTKLVAAAKRAQALEKGLPSRRPRKEDSVDSELGARTISEVTGRTPDKKEVKVNLAELARYWNTFYKDNKVTWVEPIPEDIKLTEAQATEMKRQIEVLGFDWPVIIPEGLTGEPEYEEVEGEEVDEKTKKKVKVKRLQLKKPAEHYKELHELMSEGYKGKTLYGGNYGEDGGVGASKDKRTGLRIIMSKQVQEVTEDEKLKLTMGRSIDDLEAKGGIFETLGVGGMTEAEYLIFQRVYYKETGKHLDVKLYTWFAASSRPRSGRVPCGDWDPGDQRLHFHSNDPDYQNDFRGCRLAGSFLL
ncbi:hypothetical protein A2482_00015 [Candidatus Falkowbacteria bacterium RIFOXYC2_FULL_48_21]|uniref:ATPase dynein-related AAA domain-containing protein n=1 Tax=Candidatus Falkowbacteria bacterium RIFOXYC2_FULL_48_21 TaxID=1798005 RepID=A0A1F5T587_9BACT|nr:MAG: hypothetical protein A2482_00015 [Candidatus Falkowbacteria bacterium RIFOXYC2_FULL_48_21]